MNSKLAELLFKDYRSKVLGLLLLRPDEEFHVREIARITKTIPGTLHKELSKLASAGLLLKTKKINQALYRANVDCVIYEELASILRKTSGLADVLATKLESLSGQLQVAAIYGSIASGRSTSASDIDVLLVGNIEFGDAVKALYPAEQALNREINPSVYTREEWREAVEKGSEFIQEIVAGPLIFLVGGQDDLRKFDRDITRAS